MARLRHAGEEQSAVLTRTADALGFDQPRSSLPPTINDVARLSGFSKKTVSRVINRSPLLSVRTRTAVERVIEDLGYVPNPQARGLALRRNFLLGLLHDNPNSQMVLGVQQGMLEAIKGSEFALVVRPIDRASPRMLDDVRGFLETHRLYGVMLLPPVSESDELTRLCERLGCRYVRMGSAPLDAPERAVSSDDAVAVRRAVAHLVDEGHVRIGFVAGPSGFRSTGERRAGFEAALVEASLKPTPGLVAEGDYRFDSGVAAGGRLLDHVPRPTAVFASNDEMAAGVVHAARQRNLDVPADLSVIGFDDTAIASHIWPPLTTVRWPTAEMGRSAAIKLMARDRTAAREEPEGHTSVLVSRASVAPPKVDIQLSG